jgi:hypothetical protein
MVFTFDGNNIFILIYNNPKKLNLHYFKRIEIYTKKIPIVIASLLSVVCRMQIIRLNDTISCALITINYFLLVSISNNRRKP